MSATFVLLPSEAACRAVSRALWALAVPQSRADFSTTTQFALPWCKHPARDDWALTIPAGWELLINPQTAAHLVNDGFGMRTELQNVLSARVSNWNNLRTLLQNRASGTRRLVLSDDLLPQLLPALVRTQAQMDADNWFPVI